MLLITPVKINTVKNNCITLYPLNLGIITLNFWLTWVIFICLAFQALPNPSSQNRFTVITLWLGCYMNTLYMMLAWSCWFDYTLGKWTCKYSMLSAKTVSRELKKNLQSRLTHLQNGVCWHLISFPITNQTHFIPSFRLSWNVHQKHVDADKTFSFT